MALSDKARAALRSAYASKGAHRGQLLARCPKSDTLAAAAWQGAMTVCNPYQISVGAILFMNEEQRAVYEEVRQHFETIPREFQIMAARDRETLESLGVW